MVLFGICSSHLLLNNSKNKTIVNRGCVRWCDCTRKEVAMKLAKVIVAIITAVTISVASACIASNATKLAPEQMKVWVEGNTVYLEAPDGNVWVHKIKEEDEK